MRIGLIDVDGHNFPNLPLMKLSAWHKQRGDEVEWYSHLLAASGVAKYSRVYMSKVFTFTPDFPYPICADDVFQGGTGYNLITKLSQEVEHQFPDYSLYPRLTENTAFGFLTRGCPRACEFCIVADKEGRKSVKVADLSEFWDGQKEIKLLDPNLLACDEGDDLLRQLADSGAWVDFTQGLDIRLVDRGRAELLKTVRTKMIHFAWDSPKQDLTGKFRDVKGWLGYDHRKMGVYVLTNFGSTHEEDLHRIYTLRDLGYDPYVMIYDKDNAPKKTRHLQRWANNKIVFAKCEKFENYDPKIA